MGTLVIFWILVALSSVVFATKTKEPMLDDAVKELKDSGRLKELEEKLERVLFKVDKIVEKEDINVLKRFIEEYVEERELNVKPESVYELLESLNSNDKSDPTFFVKLGSVIDVSAKLLNEGHEVMRLTKVVKAFKSVEEVKKALIKIRSNVQSRKEAQKTKNENAHKTAMEIIAMAWNGNINQELLDKIVAFAKNDLDFLLDKFFDWLMTMNMVSGTTTDVLKTQLKPILNHETTRKTIDDLFNVTQSFFKTEGGERLLAAFPKLFTGPTSAIDILQQEAAWNWGRFFLGMQNSDYRTDFLKNVATILVRGFNYISDFFTNGTNNLMINGLLLSQGLPPFNTRKPMRSIGDIVDKSLKLFSTIKVDVTEYVDVAERAYDELLSVTNAKGYFKLTDEEKVKFIERFSEEEVMGPLQAIWDIHDFMSSNDKWNCKERLLCDINAQLKKENRIKRTVMKASCVGISWFWSERQMNPTFWKSFHAIETGTAGKDCDQFGAVEDCMVFDWQNKEKMTLSYDKTEL